MAASVTLPPQSMRATSHDTRSTSPRRCPSAVNLIPPGAVLGHPLREALGLGGIQAVFADESLQRTPHFHLGEGSRIQHLVHGACHRPAHPG